MEYDIDGGNTQRDSQAASHSCYQEWGKYQEIRSGKYSEYDPLYGAQNFLLEVAGVTPDAPIHSDWFAA